MLSGQQCQQNPHHTMPRRTGIVGNDIQWDSRRPIRFTDQIEYPTNGQIINIVSRKGTVWAILSKATERAINQAGIDLTQCSIIASQTCHDLSSKTFYQDVGTSLMAVDSLPDLPSTQTNT